MLLRAKIRSGEEDLSAFEAQLFDEGVLQRAHAMPTVAQRSSGSQASRTREGASRASARASNAASGRSSKKGSNSSDPQRHSSYKQAVKQ